MKLHIAFDEKVISRCVHNFEEAFPNQNKFVVLLPSANALPKYVKTESVFSVKYGTREFWDYIGDVKQYDSVIIHSFDDETVDFVLKINHPAIYWIEWGADLYYSLLYPKGYQLFYETDIDWRMSNYHLPLFVYKFVKKLKVYACRNRYLKAARKVKYFVPDSMYDEYPLLLEYYPGLSHLEYREFYYYPIDEVVPKTLCESVLLGNNIVVGNSASLYGNHKMVFELLSQLNLGKKKIIVPLSYGIDNVANYVKDLGVSYFSNRFLPITEYLPLEDYNRLLTSASVFIYGNWRQEAVGNILVALYIGGKVFLDKRNPLLKFYRNSGLILFGLDEMTEELMMERLSNQEIMHNRAVLESMYSREKLIKLIRKNFDN